MVERDMKKEQEERTRAIYKELGIDPDKPLTMEDRWKIDGWNVAHESVEKKARQMNMSVEEYKAFKKAVGSLEAPDYGMKLKKFFDLYYCPSGIELWEIYKKLHAEDPKEYQGASDEVLTFAKGLEDIFNLDYTPSRQITNEIVKALEEYKR